MEQCYHIQSGRGGFFWRAKLPVASNRQPEQSSRQQPDFLGQPWKPYLRLSNRGGAGISQRDYDGGHGGGNHNSADEDASGGTICVQVLDEFASVALRKLGRPFPDVRQALAGIRSVCAVAATGLNTHELGLDIAERYKFSVYDAMLLAAAQSANCTTFFSEDLHHGQKVGGLTVRNPFRA